LFLIILIVLKVFHFLFTSKHLARSYLRFIKTAAIQLKLRTKIFTSEYPLEIINSFQLIIINIFKCWNLKCLRALLILILSLDEYLLSQNFLVNFLSFWVKKLKFFNKAFFLDYFFFFVNPENDIFNRGRDLTHNGFFVKFSNCLLI
jgi:hypothetical protein